MQVYFHFLFWRLLIICLHDDPFHYLFNSTGVGLITAIACALPYDIAPGVCYGTRRVVWHQAYLMPPIVCYGTTRVLWHRRFVVAPDVCCDTGRVLWHRACVMTPDVALWHLTWVTLRVYMKRNSLSVLIRVSRVYVKRNSLSVVSRASRVTKRPRSRSGYSGLFQTWRSYKLVQFLFWCESPSWSVPSLWSRLRQCLRVCNLKMEELMRVRETLPSVYGIHRIDLVYV